jgi:hypothetical protein
MEVVTSELSFKVRFRIRQADKEAIQVEGTAQTGGGSLWEGRLAVWREPRGSGQEERVHLSASMRATGGASATCA